VPNTPSTERNRSWRRQAVRDDGKIRRHPRYRSVFVDHVNANPTLRSVTKEVAVALTSYSDDTGKPAYPSQKALAKRLRRDVRTIRRAVSELEATGYLHVRRSEPERDRTTGRYHRRFNNYYCFRVPQEPLTGRRVPRKPSSHLEGTPTPSTFSGRTPPPTGGGEGYALMSVPLGASANQPLETVPRPSSTPASDPNDGSTVTSRQEAARRFARLSAQLRSARHH
jgi:hypothetical protein